MVARHVLHTSEMEEEHIITMYCVRSKLVAAAMLVEEEPIVGVVCMK
jgi:hypothetical protein